MDDSYTSSDSIFIRDLVLNMSVGIYDSEKISPQRVIINVEVGVKSNKGKALKDIAEVLSYENLINDIQKLAKSKHFNLLEEFCEGVATLCLNDKKTISAKIMAEKPDIIKCTNSVGIKIFRLKGNF